MATFTQFKSGWRAQVRRKGHKSIARTFNTKAEAERWALVIESKMGVGTYVDNRETLSTTLLECLERYASEVTPHKKGAKRELDRIKVWQSDRLATKAVGTIKQTDVAKYRDDRLNSGISGSTVKKELALLSHVFTIAIKEWGFPLTNPVVMIRKPKVAKGRDRRLEHDEEDIILGACDAEMKAFVILAIETAMRRGEIHGLQRKWIKGQVAYLPDTKNDSARAVPLSKRALEALASLPARIDGGLWRLDANSYTRKFHQVCVSIGIHDLRLHDLRHEALSRMAELGLSIMELKAIGGHNSVQMLARYVNLNVNDIAKKLG